MSVDPMAGDVDSIRRLAQVLDQRAISVDNAGDSISTAASSATSSVWEAASRTAFTAKAQEVRAQVGRVSSRIDTVAFALSDYAAKLEQIQSDARTIKAAQRRNDQDIASSTRTLDRLSTADEDQSMTEVVTASALGVAYQTTKLALDRSWNDLVARRQAADAAVIAKLQGDEALGTPPPSASAVDGMSDAAFLAWLASQPADALPRIGLDKAVTDRLGQIRDPKVIADWWNSLGGPDGEGSASTHSDAQQALVDGVPLLIGNLNGVAYWARDKANRATLKNELRRAGGVDAAAYSNIESALKKYDGTSLISLYPEHPPLAAVAMGDMDTAENVTYVVPGMNSDTRNMTVVERAAYNLRTKQGDWSDDTTAVVAWINYATPTPTTVLHGDLARAGSTRLADDLAGFNATRGDSKGTLNVVAHSYGSTMSSLTLADHDLGVDSYVVAGSAGIERRIADAGDIHAGVVYAAQAPRVLPFIGGKGDQWSSIGQAFSMTRTDPAVASFGATYLPTAGQPGDPQMHGVTTHDPLIHGPHHPDDYGYFDTNTESLDNIARATTKSFPN
ncbi:MULTISPECIES: alpha/beta hydrolase [unclassified Curtobacterium]|uniref:alpha/beta hydrolase n=1 Tax=unclassified Curtobacterium TaxID=257496 RepID=UPI00226B62CB|nr:MULTISPECIES: alpha/beta hydrolase [unclassified Curtobacterium]